MISEDARVDVMQFEIGGMDNLKHSETASVGDRGLLVRKPNPAQQANQKVAALCLHNY